MVGSSVGPIDPPNPSLVSVVADQPISTTSTLHWMQAKLWKFDDTNLHSDGSRAFWNGYNQIQSNRIRFYKNKINFSIYCFWDQNLITNYTWTLQATWTFGWKTGGTDRRSTRLIDDNCKRLQTGDDCSNSWQPLKSSNCGIASFQCLVHSATRNARAEMRMEIKMQTPTSRTVESGWDDALPT